MAGLIYHIPNCSNANRKACEEAGIELVDDAALPGGICDKGPSGEPGAVFSVKCLSVPKVGYYPDKQKWFDCGKHWIGYEVNNPVKPEDVRRFDALAGHNVRLNDGNLWEIPVIRHLDGRMAIETKIDWTDDGEGLVFNPIEKHKAMVDLIERIWDSSIDHTLPTVSDGEILRMCVLAIKNNYMLGRREIGRLGLLTTKNMAEVIRATIDIPTLLQAEQIMRQEG